MKHIFIISCLFISSYLDAFNSGFATPEIELAVGEQIHLLTDRNLYAVQERVYFKVNYVRSKELQDLEWSKVVYIELLNPNGQVEVKQKLPLGKNGANGALELPKELLSGYYYLRAYTKWMVNFGEDAFSYAPIIVINPFTDKIFTPKKANTNDVINLNENKGYNIAQSFSLETDKSNYNKREKVQLKIKLDKEHGANSNFVISVVKSASLDSNYMASSITTGNAGNRMSMRNIEYLPESRGMRISGSMGKPDGQPGEERKIVNLSIIGDEPYFSQTYTKKNGEFNFTLPEKEGELNLFLCPSGVEETNVQFKVNNGVSDLVIPIATKDFALTPSQIALSKELMINSQLESIYPKNIDSSQRVISQSSSIPFYGTPESRVYLDEFIVLPNLGEVFFELIHDVYVMKKKKLTYFKVVDDNHWSSIMPLVLLDNVPIYDLSTILGIPSQKFDYIDVINTYYKKGDMLFSGIISIYTKNSDMAGAELPKGGAFFSYTAFADQSHTVVDGQTQEQKNIPDLRNCLYWNPDLPTNGKQEVEIEFYTSDNTGEYTVLIRGVAEDETGIELGSCKFSVE